MRNKFFKKTTKWLSLLFAGVATMSLVACVNEPSNTVAGYDSSKRVNDERTISTKDYSIFNTTATDDFARVSETKDGQKADKDRYVGMFYFLTLGQHSDHYGIYDISKILKQYGRPGFDGNHDYSPVGAAHFWGEPIYGYYTSDDEWVIRKQIELLTFMDIDFLGLDVSNGYLYEKVITKLFNVIAEYRALGWRAPQIMFYSGGGGNPEADLTNLKKLDKDFYSNAKYSDVWFKPNGKPMTVLLQETAEEMELETSANHNLYLKYDIKYRQWPNEPNRMNGFPWMDFTYPQHIYQKKRGEKEGIINVSVGQHKTIRFSDTAGTRGRGWSPESMKNDHERYNEDLNFQAQWKTVNKNDDEIKYVFVTGWNEWVATKMYRPDLNPAEPYLTVDQYNDEYSRDLEPTRTGKLRDNSFLLSTKETRDYKMNEAKHYKYPNLSPAVNNIADEKWNSANLFEDFIGENINRNAPRMDGLMDYVDTTNRNDISNVRVAKDGSYLYFKVACANDITAYSNKDTRWMNINIKTQNKQDVDAKGYHYVINREINGNKTIISKATGGKTYENVGEGDLFVNGKEMIVRVPLKTLNLSENNYDIEFKVTDNVQSQTNVMDFYITGDSAPCGRLNYKFGY